ncbi:MAG: adenine phosphoribosyltransferase [Oscillospiraceae bacterium]|nr:adenine phosphoribosyltransferase [Oscillospiraceae bacterium]
MNTYTLKVAGLTRELRYFPIGNGLYIAGFIMFGDVELTVRCAEELLKKCPDFDLIITAEAKGIPLAYEMVRQSGMPKGGLCSPCGGNSCEFPELKNYIVVRKQPKLYMSDVMSVDSHSITTEGTQTLHLDGADSHRMSGQRVLIVDDVISTGESVAAVERLVVQSGGVVAGRAAVLAEGDATERADLVYLERLAIFDESDIRGV